jgi:hypothetical protein
MTSRSSERPKAKGIPEWMSEDMWAATIHHVCLCRRTDKCPVCKFFESLIPRKRKRGSHDR